MARLSLRRTFSIMILLSLPGNVAAAEIAQIRLDETFPHDQRGDFQQVAEDVWQLVRARMPAEPPAGERPIQVIFRADEPPLCDATSDASTYRIYVSATNRRYAQFAYQLAHELGHVMLDPRRTHAVAETLAEALSLQILADLAAHWESDPPYEHWRSYAAQFGSYRQQMTRRRLDAFPTEIAQAVAESRWELIAMYLRWRLAEQDRVVEQRDLNGLAALALLSDAVDWSEFRGLAGRTIPSAEEEGRFRRDLTLPPRVLPKVLQRTGRGVPTVIAAVAYRDKTPPIPATAGLRLDLRSDGKRILLMQAHSVEALQPAKLKALPGVLSVDVY